MSSCTIDHQAAATTNALQTNALYIVFVGAAHVWLEYPNGYKDCDEYWGSANDPDRSSRLSIIIMQVMPGSDYDVPFNMQCLFYCRGSSPRPMEVLAPKPVDT